MIVVAGESLVDLTPVRGSGSDALYPHAGGSPLNVAVGVGRLEVPASFLGRLSGDAFGRMLRRHLEDSGVDLGLTGGSPAGTSLAVVALDEAGHPEYAFYFEGTASPDLLPEHLPSALPDGAMLHLGSIGMVIDPMASTLAGLLRREAGRRLISLDPNARPSIFGDRDAYLGRLKGWLPLVDVIKISDEDLEWLHPGEDPEAVASRWLELGAGLVLVTLGAHGSVALRAGGVRAEAPCPPVEVADTVGAGDAFMAATLAHLHDNGVRTREAVDAMDADALGTLLTVANAYAAETCTRVGADPPRRADAGPAWG